MSNDVRLEIIGNTYILRIGSAFPLIINGFKDLEELMKDFDFKLFHVEHFIIRWKGGENYQVQSSLNGDSPIYIKTLNLTLLFVIENYHLSKF